ELVFSKIRGKDPRPGEIINVEEFISVKGIKALGNQLTSEKIKQVNLLDPVPYEPVEIPKEAIEVNDEETVEGDEKMEPEAEIKKNISGESQIKLFDE